MSSEIFIYLFLLLLIVAFWVWELWISKKSIRKFDPDEPLKGCVYSDEQPVDAGIYDPVGQTIATLGPERYEKMTVNLSKLLKRHENDDFVTFKLQKEDLTEDCSKTLHNLIPGDRLFLLREDSDEGIVFKIFADGRMIGRLSHTDSYYVVSVMADSAVKGLYVWKQNCFGNCDFTDLDMVLFFESSSEVAFRNFSAVSDPSRLKVSGLNQFNLYQN